MSSNHPVETNPRYASTATTDGFSADGNAGGQKGGDLGTTAMGYLKEGHRQSEKFRQGINSFADNAIQPSAARDADRGVTESSKGNFRPSEHGVEGHEIREGPARGTGTSGLGGKTGFRESANSPTGIMQSDGHTGTVGTGGKLSFSSDAQVLMGKAKQAWADRKSSS